jgi:hypothetical protein
MHPPITLWIHPVPGGRFEILDGDRVLGTCQNEMMAIWSSVTIAEELARSGNTVRVTALRDGKEFEEYLAKAR